MSFKKSAPCSANVPNAVARCKTFSRHITYHVAHSSTGGSEVPAYDRCYILATDIYVIVFRAVYIEIYDAVLIATPEAVQASVRAIYYTGKI